jgi:hypothetical protein
MTRTLIILTVVSVLLAGWVSAGLAADFFEPGDEPSSAAVAYDALLCRPFGLAAIGFGAAAFVATLPGSVPSRNCHAAARAFLKEPTYWTFKRRLGTRTLMRKQYFLP